MTNNKILYVGFIKRVYAALLDLLFFLPFYPLFIILQKYSFTHRTVIPIIFSRILVIILLAYLLSRFGGTPGKLILGIRILNKEGKHLNIFFSLARLTPMLVMTIAQIIQNYFVYQIIPKEIQATSIIKISQVINYYSNLGPFPLLINLLGFLCLLDVIIIAINKKKRAFHDIVARSYVISKKVSNFKIDEINT